GWTRSTCRSVHRRSVELAGRVAAVAGRQVAPHPRRVITGISRCARDDNFVRRADVAVNHRNLRTSDPGASHPSRPWEVRTIGAAEPAACHSERSEESPATSVNGFTLVEDPRPAHAALLPHHRMTDSPALPTVPTYPSMQTPCSAA